MARAASNRRRSILADSPVTLSLDQLIALRALVTESRDPMSGNSPWAGRFRGTRRGQGMDFDDLRPYVPGDDPRHIDWKVSARLGITHSRLYREEKEHALTLLLDLRDAMYTGSHELRAVVAGRRAAIELWQAADVGSRIAAMVVDSDGIRISERATGERGALRACALIAERFDEVFARLSPSQDDKATESASQNPSLDAIADRCENEGRRLGRIRFITGLDEIQGYDNEASVKALYRLNLRSPTTVLHIADPLEVGTLPIGSYRYRANHDASDRGTTHHTRLDRKRRKTLTGHLQSREAAIVRTCRRAGVDLQSVVSATMAGR